MHVTSRFGPFQEDCSSSNSTDDDNRSLAKSQSYLTSLQKARKRNNPKHSGKEVQIYFAEDILHFDEDPLTFWKKKSEELPTLAMLAKEFLGLQQHLHLQKDYFQLQEISTLQKEIYWVQILFAA